MRETAMRAWVLGLSLLVCCLGPLTASTANEPERQARGAAPSLVIEHRGDLLSVRLHGAPWAAVLQELTRPTGIELRVVGPLAGTLTQAFAALPLEQGLRRLFRDVNYVFIYAPGAQGEPGAAQVRRVWLFPQEGHEEERQRYPSPAEPAAVEPQEVAGTWRADTETDLVALRNALADADPTVRGYAIQALAGREGVDAIAWWRVALRDPEPAVRLRALEGLARHAEGRALLQEALADEDDTVRAMAAFLLEQGAPTREESGHAGRPW